MLLNSNFNITNLEANGEIEKRTFIGAFCLERGQMKNAAISCDVFKRDCSNGAGGLAMPLKSNDSMRVSLESIRNGEGGLNKHRQSLLNRVPDRESWVLLKLNTVKYKDIAYLSAATGDEFALLRGKNEDILYHGTPMRCHIERDKILLDMLISHKIHLEIHSHPDYGRISPSEDDRRFISRFGQKTSKIISSYTGQIVGFHDNSFDDY